MKIEKLLVVIFFVIVELVQTQANAALVEQDWKISGDKLITYDTATGLEWLDLTQSVNRTYNDVASQFSLAGDYQGFRFATYTEVTGIVHGLGITISGSFLNRGEQQKVADLLSLVGVTRTVPNFENSGDLWQSFAFHKSYGGLYNQYEYTVLEVHFGTGRTALEGAYNTQPNQSAPQLASYLVRPASVVPIPAAYWLLGSGLLGLIGVARRKAA